MEAHYCDCGIRLRQWFNDVFSCPRCQTILVEKDHVRLLWRGDTAAVMLDELEKHVTKFLLDRREEASADMGDEAPSIAPKPAEVPEQGPTRPCDCCNAPMPAGCGKICTNCKWVSPCSIG